MFINNFLQSIKYQNGFSIGEINIKKYVTKILECNINNLINVKFPFDEKFGLKIISDDEIIYNFIINIKTNSDKLLIFGPGAIPPSSKEKYLNKPVFSRVTWSFNYSTIFYDDPTRLIKGVDILGGWGIGTTKKWFTYELSKIIKIIANKIYMYTNENIYKNIIFYGSSMAGFMSIQLATLVKNSIAIAEIPQLDLMEWPYWPKLQKELFNDFTELEIKKNFSYRLSIYELIIKEEYIPNAFLILDCSHEFDFQRQYKNFLINLDTLPFKKNNNINKIRIRIDGKNKGHEPLNYTEVCNIIDNIDYILTNSFKNQNILTTNSHPKNGCQEKKSSEYSDSLEKIDIIKIIDTFEEFLISSNFFDEIKYEFIIFKIIQLSEYIPKFNCNDYFNKVKLEFIILNEMYNLNYLPKKDLQILNNVIHSKDLNEYLS